MVDVFKEVNEELKDEEFRLWLKKFGPKIIALSIALVLFTAGRVIYTNHKTAVNQKQTVILNEILDANEEVIKSITDGSEKLNDNHKVLSNFLLAAAYVEDNDLVKANEIYESIVADRSVSKEYKDVATVYIVQNILNSEDADLEKARELVSPTVANKDNSFYYIAIEQKALIEIKSENIQEAKNIFDSLAGDVDAPSRIRDRAKKLSTLY